MAIKASDFMTRKSYTCGPDSSADAVFSFMIDKKFRHIPVIEKGHLSGIITRGDVVKVKLSEVSMEKDALENMISDYF